MSIFDVPAPPTLTARYDTAGDGTLTHYLVISWTEVSAQTSTYRVRINDGTDTSVRDVSGSPLKLAVTSGINFLRFLFRFLA